MESLPVRNHELKRENNKIKIGKTSLLQKVSLIKDFSIPKKLMLNVQNEHHSSLLNFFPYLYLTDLN